MKNYLKLFLLTILIASSSTVNAQFLKNIGKRISKTAEKKIEERIEKKGEKATDRALDSIFEKPNKNNEKNNPMGDMGGIMDMMNNMGNVEIEPSYTFHTTITMDRFGAGVDVRDRTMIQRLGDSVTLTEIPNTKMIMDLSNNAMITLMEETKQAQVINMGMMDGFINMDNEEDEEVMEVPVVSSLGSTIKIAGYTCRHKSIETSKQRIDIWYTDEVDVDMTAYITMMKSLPSSSNRPQDIMENNISGFVMQMDVINKETDVFFGTKVKAIDFETTQINMSDYTLLKM